MSSIIKEGTVSSIQFIRFVFVLIIVIYNFPIDSILYENLIIKNINLFISFFFVLSSYLLYLRLNSKKITKLFVIKSLKKHFIKYYPTHLLFLLIFAIIEIAKIYYINRYDYSPLYETYSIRDFILNFFL